MPSLKSIKTEMVINASQDAVTSPAPEPEVAATPPSKQKSQNNNATTREGSTESTQVVKESLEDIPENYPQRQGSSPRTPARQVAGPALPEESEDLYDATPLAQRPKPSTKPLVTGQTAEQTQVVATTLVVNIETQNVGATTISAESSTKGPRLSQLFADVPDLSAEATTAKVTPKPKLLTQTSKSDKLEPAPATSTDPPASCAGRKNSNQSSTQFATPRNASAGSKTSAMASTAKSAAATLKHSKSQPAATGTSAKAKLEAMKVAQPGASASTKQAPTKSASTTKAPSKAKEPAQARPSKSTSSRAAEEKVTEVADNGLDNEQPAPSGKLPRLSKRIAAMEASISKPKNAPNSDAPTAQTKPAMTVPNDVKKTTNIAKEGKLKGIPALKQKAGPFVEEDDDMEDARETDEPIHSGDSKLDSNEPTKHTRAVVTAASRKRKVDDEGLHESENDKAPMARATRKRPGAVVGASTTSKRKKQAATSSWNDDVGDSEYEVPVSPVKKTLKKGKAADKAKATSPRKATRTTKNGKGHAEASASAKATGSTRAVAKMEVDAKAGEDRGPHGSIAKQVRGQAKGVKKTAVGTIKSPQTRGDDVAMAAGSKAQGKKAVPRVKDEGSNVPAKKIPASRPDSNANGETQDDAIVLSDNEDKSSSYAGSLTSGRPVVTARNATTALRTSILPKTPGPAMRLSPSRAVEDDARQLEDLQKTVRQHKPQFIEWDKSGPRNQGVAAVKTPAPRSAKGASVAPSVKRKHDPSSFATSVRSGRPTQRAPSSNIASNVDDALSNLVEKQVKPSFQMSPDPDDQALVQHAQQDIERLNVAAIEADDEFTNIDTYDDDDHTLVQMSPPSKPISADPPAEQQKRPSPVKASATTASTKASAQRPETTVLQNQAVLSKPLDAKTTPYSPKRPPQKPRKPAPARVEAQAEVVSSDHEADTQPRMKRPLSTEDEIKPPAKRSKADVNVANIVDRGRRRTKATQPALELDMVDPDTPHGGAVEVMPPPAAPAKPLRASKKHSPVLARTAEPEPARRVRGRPSRQKTHGSQTVDVHGSPVPSQMVVGQMKTVLETYSQQAGLVSDQDAVEKTLKRQRTQTLANEQQPENDLRYNVPQSHQPEPLSSNTKPVPAAPQAASKVVPKLHLTQSQSEKLLGNRNNLAKMLDPFSSSNNGVATDGSERSGEVMNGLAFQLEEKMKHLEGQPQSDEDESDATVIYTEHQKPEVEPSQEPVSTSTSSGNEAETYDDDMAKLRAITSLTRHRQQEDPDKTLVNDDDVDEPQQYGKDAPLEESQQEPEELELSEPASDDLMAWRKTLKPHQLNLFQELIKTARRLTHYFVEQENSVLRNVEKAHRQKVYAIEQEEMVRAKTYQTKNEELKRVRKSKKKELKQFQAKLMEKLEQKKGEKEKRAIKAAQWEEDNANLETLISKLSEH